MKPDSFVKLRRPGVVHTPPHHVEKYCPLLHLHTHSKRLQCIKSIVKDTRGTSGDDTQLAEAQTNVLYDNIHTTHLAKCVRESV